MSKPKTLICRFTAEQVHQAKNYHKYSAADKAANPRYPEVGQVTEEHVKFRAVSAEDIPMGYETPADKDVQSFAEASPWGEMQVMISNLNAIGVVKDGLDYYIKIEQVPDELQTNQAALEFHKRQAEQ